MEKLRARRKPSNASAPSSRTHLTHGLDLVDHDATAPVLRATLLARRAEEHASAEDDLHAGRDLDAAQSVLDTRNRPGGFWTNWAGGSGHTPSTGPQILGYRGIIDVMLGNRSGVDVLRTAHDAVYARGDSWAFQRCAISTDLAAAHIADAEIGKASSLLAEAEGETGGMSINFGRIDGARDRLTPWQGTPEVRELDDVLYEHREGVARIEGSVRR